ncbi:hypothetical protein J4225_04990 [Candidatus Pacearchaeota archaeon]|nr:hypothetical protein [Candidatus Pacearchaeota archaeon]
MQEKEHILEVLGKTKEALKRQDVIGLKELSNMTIHSASIYKDTDCITIAVVIYALSKIIERRDDKNSKQCNEFCKKAGLSIERAIAALKNDNEEELKNNIEAITSSIKNLSGDLKDYVQDVFRKAQINKASKIYEHGISMEQTAELLGLTLFELAGYAGQRQIVDAGLNKTKDVKSRIKLAMEMFE